MEKQHPVYEDNFGTLMGLKKSVTSEAQAVWRPAVVNRTAG